MTEWEKNCQAWDCDLSRIFFFFFFFFTFYFGMILDFQKNYEDTKECSHILIIQTPLYNILHDCNFYAVLSKLTKLALLLFYSLQTFFWDSSFFHLHCLHVPRSSLGFNHHVSLSVSIWDYFWASFYIFVQIIECFAFLVCFIQKWKSFHIYQFNENLWSVGHNTLFLALKYKHDEIILILETLIIYCEQIIPEFT